MISGRKKEIKSKHLKKMQLYPDYGARWSPVEMEFGALSNRQWRYSKGFQRHQSYASGEVIYNLHIIMQNDQLLLIRSRIQTHILTKPRQNTNQWSRLGDYCANLKTFHPKWSRPHLAPRSLFPVRALGYVVRLLSSSRKRALCDIQSLYVVYMFLNINGSNILMWVIHLFESSGLEPPHIWKWSLTYFLHNQGLGKGCLHCFSCLEFSQNEETCPQRCNQIYISRETEKLPSSERQPFFYHQPSFKANIGGLSWWSNG